MAIGVLNFPNDCRYMMASWTPQHSTLLSALVDGFVGTSEMINTRQDFCKIYDCASSIIMQKKYYFTGSKSEGLELFGSDEDYMVENNSIYNVKVTQELDVNTSTSPYCTFLMSTEYVRPGFTLLQHVPQTPLDSFLVKSSRNMNGLRYLSSDLFIQNSLIKMQSASRTGGSDDFLTMRRQGPSKEITHHGILTIKPLDHVDCIHCAFWPSEASEWRDRPRHFGWPTQDDLMSITDFGFHLVAIGHPHSDTKEMEWRMSFSIAERTLVWSFNRIQMQCYALMKIILKEFIKVRCSQQNQSFARISSKRFYFGNMKRLT